MGQWHASVDIPATARGVAAARHVVTVLLPSWDLPDELCGDAELIVSELVTYAYRHAPGTDSFELALDRRTDGIRLSLADGSSIRPLISELSTTAPSGRGMTIVERLASRWGADDYRGGKRVWVDLDEASTG
jgi:anti-sigma regulatory factor (Ser/Thr protein kinase)